MNWYERCSIQSPSHGHPLLTSVPCCSNSNPIHHQLPVTRFHLFTQRDFLKQSFFKVSGDNAATMLINVDVSLVVDSTQPNRNWLASWTTGEAAYSPEPVCCFRLINGPKLTCYHQQLPDSYASTGKCVECEPLRMKVIETYSWQVDGCKLAAGSYDGTLVVWNANGNKCFEVKKHSDWIRSICWKREAGEQHFFVTGSDDKVIYRNIRLI